MKSDFEIQQEIDRNIKLWIGEAVIHNSARQARVEALLADNAALQARVAELDPPKKPRKARAPKPPAAPETPAT